MNKLFWCEDYENRSGWCINTGSKIIPVFGPSICKSSAGGSNTAREIANEMGYKISTIKLQEHKDINGNACNC